MSKWTYVQDAETNRVDVVPCTDQGFPLRNHILDPSCPCFPTLQENHSGDSQDDALEVWVHNDPERGGYNA